MKARALPHCRTLCDSIWRSVPGQEAFRWHPWLEDQLEEYCQSGPSDSVTVTGPGSAAKRWGRDVLPVILDV